MDITITLSAGANLYIGNNGECRVEDTTDLEELQTLEDKVKELTEKNNELLKKLEDEKVNNEASYKQIQHMEEVISDFQHKLETKCTECDELAKHINELEELNALSENLDAEQRVKIEELTKENLKLKSKNEAYKQSFENSPEAECLITIVCNRAWEHIIFSDTSHERYVPVISFTSVITSEGTFSGRYSVFRVRAVTISSVICVPFGSDCEKTRYSSVSYSERDFSSAMRSKPQKARASTIAVIPPAI